jgi:hypothetical protein
MDVLTVILMIGLFIFLLVFIFSAALLTPLIGKRNILFVIFLGFTVGAVGGAFFIAPAFDDIPVIASSIITSTSPGTDMVDINVSTDVNISDFIQNTSKIDGVKSIQSNGITIITDPMTNSSQSYFITRIPEQDSNVTSVEMPTNDTMVLDVKNNTNPVDTINNIQSWMMYVSGMSISYSVVNVTMAVQSSKYTQVMAQLPQGEVVITNVSGPSINNLQEVSNIMPNKSNIILFCGFIGVVTGLSGMFIDSIIGVLQRVRRKVSEFRK